MSRISFLIIKILRLFILAGLIILFVKFGPKPRKIFPIWIGIILSIPFVGMFCRGIYAYWFDEKESVTMDEHLPSLYYGMAFLLCAIYLILGGIR